MQIGEVIRENRKRKNLTQEEMAKRLGVTAPAVNKWENGNSQPDIMLLAPIARLLEITIDTLLSFKENPTTEEINSIIQEANIILKSKTYDEAFQWAADKINQFPNCDQLIWQIAVVFDAWRLMKDIPDTEKYDVLLNDYFVRALQSKDENIRTNAANSLFEFYVRKEQFDKAEEYLSYLSMENPERKRKQAIIYSKTNRLNEAYKTYEELLFSGYQMLSMVLTSIYILLMSEENKTKAHIVVEKQGELAHLFEMGAYHEASFGLDLATAEKDVEKTLQIMERLMNNLDTICDFRHSVLYEHMEFKDPSADFLKNMKKDLLLCFEDEETFGYMKDNSRWKALI
jgi:transcriptional regulator with XRE-family HTH domain